MLDCQCASLGLIVSSTRVLTARIALISSIAPLLDMLATGDRIERIEGVFSGTMSYIFNEWSKASGGSARPFSEVVKVAKEKGYTEPHPGDDLNGSDVARKLAILARLVAGSSGQRLDLSAGFESVQTASLVPAGLETVSDGEDFLLRLKEHDAHFESMRAQAAEAGCVLRFVGVVDASTGEIKAEAALRRWASSGSELGSMRGRLMRTGRVALQISCRAPFRGFAGRVRQHRVFPDLSIQPASADCARRRRWCGSDRDGCRC